MDEPAAGERSVIEQYGKRKRKARESWAWHVLFALAPFSVFMWGERAHAIPAAVVFVACLARGVYRQTRIDRCPACEASRWMWSFNAFGAHGRVSMRPDCRSCGVQLLD